jgi:hypothetical protein
MSDIRASKYFWAGTQTMAAPDGLAVRTKIEP